MQTARARRTDPETSHEAAAGVRDLRTSQQQVLSILARHGNMTDVALVRAANKEGLQQSASGLRTRRNELVQRGKVELKGHQRIRNRRHRIWGLV